MSCMPHRWAGIFVLLLAAQAPSSGAQAARPFFDVQPMGVTAPRFAPESPTIGTGLSWQTRRGTAWLRGSADAMDGALTLRSFDGELRVAALQLGAFDLGLGSRAQLDAARNGGSYGTAAGDVRLGTRGARYGLRVGAGATASHTPGAGLISPSAHVAGWFRVFGVSASAQLTRYSRAGLFSFDSLEQRITIIPQDSIATDSSYVYTRYTTDTSYTVVRSARDARAMVNEARFALGARIADVFIDGAGGVYFGRDWTTRPYGTITATRWVTPRIAMMAGAELRVLDPSGGLTQRRLVFGLRLAPQRVPSGLVDAPNAAPTQLALSRSGDHVTISIRAPGARSVEIAGDFTEWNPVVLSRARGDRWEVTVPLAPGVYRLNLRVDDGAWTPPPGVSRTVDAYEGTVGVLVVS